MAKARKLIARPQALLRMGGFTAQTARNHERHDPAWPKPYRLSNRLVGYLEADVERWLASRPIAGGKAPEAAIAASRSRVAARRALATAPENGNDE